MVKYTFINNLPIFSYLNFHMNDKEFSLFNDVF